MHLIQPSIRLPEQKRSLRILLHAASYRVPLPVTQIVQYAADEPCYPVCPRCKRGMDREYMSFCDRCGQKMNWKYFDNAKILTAPIAR